MQSNLLRYSCQLALPGFTEATQQTLQNARVLIVGVGGLGCPAAQYLAAAGIGTLGLADFDVVTTGNLHRQILFTPDEVGQPKAPIATRKLHLQNPGCKLVPYVQKITSENITQLLQHYDLVLDCTDNFDTRYLLNDACVLAGKPMVYGAIYQYEGQVAVWNIKHPDGTYTPNYRDVYPDAVSAQVPDCAEGGVIPTLAGIIGCMQANEAIKYFTNPTDLLADKLLLFDAQTMQSRTIKLGNTTKVTITKLPATIAVPTLTIAEARQTIATGNCMLLDVRNQQERESYSLGGEHIPLNALDPQADLLATGKAIIVYCASGKRSAEAVKQLKKHYPDKLIYSLEGGLKAWREQV